MRYFQMKNALARAVSCNDRVSLREIPTWIDTKFIVPIFQWTRAIFILRNVSVECKYLNCVYNIIDIMPLLLFCSHKDTLKWGMKLLSPAQSPHTCALHKFIIYIQNNAQSIGTSPNTKIYSVVWRFSPICSMWKSHDYHQQFLVNLYVFMFLSGC